MRPRICMKRIVTDCNATHEKRIRVGRGKGFRSIASPGFVSPLNCGKIHFIITAPGSVITTQVSLLYVVITEPGEGRMYVHQFHNGM